MLVSVASSVLSGADALEALVSRLREAFGMTSVLLREGDDIVAAATDPVARRRRGRGDHAPARRERRASTCAAECSTPPIVACSAPSLSQLETALVQRRLYDARPQSARPLAEADRLRSALLAAVGHDLRRPLAAATAAVTSLRSPDVTLEPGRPRRAARRPPTRASPRSASSSPTCSTSAGCRPACSA